MKETSRTPPLFFMPANGRRIALCTGGLVAFSLRVQVMKSVFRIACRAFLFH